MPNAVRHRVDPLIQTMFRPPLLREIPMSAISPIRRVASIATTLGVLLAAPASAQNRPFDLEKTRSVLTGIIDKALNERGVPSISIALVRGDSIVWKAAFGYVNVRTKTSATTETLHSTGSTFKSATATALMQLAEQAKLSLDHPVNRYLDDVPVQDRLQS